MKPNFSRRRFLGASSVALAALSLPQLACAQVQPRRAADANGNAKPMNIVFINTDDMGTQMGAYGDKLARTPNLDALAARGVLFENGYVTQASCSPSRSSFLTGLYPHQNGQLGLSHLGYRVHDGIPNLPALLQKAGYYNAIVGKLHLSPEKDFPFDFAEKDAKKTWDVKFVADTVARQMKAAGDKPFFLYLNYFDPHKPFNDTFEGIPAKPQTPAEMKPLPFLPVEDADLGDGVREDLAGYYNGVARADVGIGLVLDEIKKAGHENDTLVIFIGDHGPPFTRSKNSALEGGLKIPFIVHWPGQSQAHRDERLVSTIDIMPTILDAANLEAPADLPGSSLRPLMASGEAKWRTLLGAENNAHGAESWFPQRTIRDARFKLIYTINPGKNPKPVGDGGRPWLDLALAQAKGKKGTLAGDVFERQLSVPQWQMFDLQNDPWEFVDLSGNPKFAEDEKRLVTELLKWRIETKDPLLDPNYLAALNKAHAETEGAKFDEKKWDANEPKAQIPTLAQAMKQIAAA